MLVGEGEACRCRLIVGADELAAVAAEGIAGEVYFGWQGFCAVFDGVVGGAAAGVEQGNA